MNNSFSPRATLSLWLALASLGAGACGPAMPSADGGAGDGGSSLSDVNVIYEGGAAPTWSQDVAPILYAQCASCHRPDTIAPFSLLTYDDAADRAGLIAAETRARTMPPTVINASGSCQQFRPDVHWLSDAELATLQAWAAAGAPQGDPALAPAPPAAPSGLAHVDAQFDLGTTYTPDSPNVGAPGASADEYRCFLADPGNATDSFITGYQVLPGDAREVHHLIVYALPTAAIEQAAVALDNRDATPGYPCVGGPGVDGAAPLVLWAPGASASSFPEGTGLRLVGGRRVVMQVHYNLLNGSFPDRTAVQLQLAPSVANEAQFLAVNMPNFTLPGNSPSTTVNYSRRAPAAGRIWGVAPHMHTLGRALQLQANGQCLVNVDDRMWNFHWQRLFFYDQPLAMASGASLALSCTYDTSSRGTQTTTRGESTENEMCLAYLYVTAH